jgi:hypothetical protein
MFRPANCNQFSFRCTHSKGFDFNKYNRIDETKLRLKRFCAYVENYGANSITTIKLFLRRSLVLLDFYSA